jgi:cation:H+ antiporter
MPPLVVLFSKVLLALAILTVGADVLVRGASSLALRLGVSALAVGLTVVAFGTSAPELVVSLSAAFRGASDIAVGNVVGSNICNIALILGLAALIRPIVVEAKVFRFDAPLLIVVSVLLSGLLLTGGLTRLTGGAFFLGVGGYTAATLWFARREGRAVQKEFAAGVPAAGAAIALDFGMVIAGLLGLMLGGRLFVGAAVSLAETLGISQAVIGLTVVAVGTSLPELATSIVAAIRGQGDIAVGNIVGSNIFNILGILGATALVQPLPMGGIERVDLAVMLLLAVALLPILRTGFVVSRIEGGLLLASYIGYVAWRLAS